MESTRNLSGRLNIGAIAGGILATIFFLSIMVYQPTQVNSVLRDGFEAFPNDWSIEIQNGTVETSKEIVHNETYSLRIYSPSTESYASVSIDIPAGLSQAFHFQIWFYVDSSIPTDHMYLADFRDSQSFIQSRVVATDSNGKCYVAVLKSQGSGYEDSSYWNVCSISKDSWHKLELIWNASEYTIKVDDQDYGVFQPRSPNISVEKLYLGDTTVGGFSGLIYFDDLTMKP